MIYNTPTANQSRVDDSMLLVRLFLQLRIREELHCLDLGVRQLERRWC